MVHERPVAVRSGGAGGVRKIDQAKPLFKEKLTDLRMAAGFPEPESPIGKQYAQKMPRESAGVAPGRLLRRQRAPFSLIALNESDMRENIRRNALPLFSPGEGVLFFFIVSVG